MRLRRTLVATLPLLAIVLSTAAFVAPKPLAARAASTLISAPDGNLFLVYDGERHSVNSPTLLALGIVEQSSLTVSQETLEAIHDGAPIPTLQDGTLLVGPDGGRYLLFDGLHPIPNSAAYDSYGWNGYNNFQPAPLLAVDADFLAALPLQAPVAAVDRGPNRFDWGYCTWWVAQRRTVTWRGDAIEWYANAQAQGYAVGDMPAPGAILVRRSATWTGYGHVAYVESVDGTTFTVSEMNVAGLGQLSTRTYNMVSDPPPGLVGFIYWQYGKMVAPLNTELSPDEASPMPVHLMP